MMATSGRACHRVTSTHNINPLQIGPYSPHISGRQLAVRRIAVFLFHRYGSQIAMLMPSDVVAGLDGGTTWIGVSSGGVYVIDSGELQSPEIYPLFQ